MGKNHLNILYHKYLRNHASAEEIEDLFRIIDESNQNQLDKLAEDGFSETVSEKEADRHEKVVLSRVFEKILMNRVHHAKTKISKIKRLFKYSVAASLFVVIGFAMYFYVNSSEDNNKNASITNNFIPERNKATLLLSDGRSIDLSDEKAEVIIDVSNIKYKDGTIIHDAANLKDAYSTIVTSNGGQYQVKLPDGTRVWLNAMSKIKFPNSFSSYNREVEVEGEVYFEIAQIQDSDKKRIPFHVKSKEQSIEVLGTHFNVNSYMDEEDVRTTLFEGSIKISHDGSDRIHVLTPGQQAILRKGTLSINSVDLYAALAWKNGVFVFNNESLESIMKKVSRWYDIEVVFKNDSENKKFSGVISRTKNLSEVLKIMEMTDQVIFKIDGRRVTIMM